MRVVKEIPHGSCKITIYAWNNRYLVKLEQGMLEQTYKISELDLTSEDELLQILDDNFLAKAMTIFREMNQNLADAAARASG
jgi:hypothetical protein